MLFLWLTTLLWAFSFSFIGVYLAGQVDSYFSVFTRTALALLVFLPFLVRYRTSPKIALQMMLIGALQLGLMYLFYYHSFLLLTVPEILVFRSEERRVGKECRSRWSSDHYKKKS